jgi:hypothetical protein
MHAVPRSCRRIVIAAAAAVAIGSICTTARAEFVDTLVDSGNANTNALNLQTAIDNALNRLGETRIVLPASATFCRTGGSAITLKKKTLDDAYCTIESSALGSLSPGKRISPANAGSMPDILSPGSNLLAVKTQVGAHHYRLRGLEISSQTAATLTALVSLGDDVQAVQTDVPHHIDIDRCYIHAFDSTQALTRCVALHSANSVISNSYLSDAKALNDAQAIGGYNGSGPFFIVNNYLEGSGENYLMGGAGCRLPDTPNDITFKRNYCAKPLAWQASGAWTVKNLFEIKFGKRYDIQGNIFDNTWADGQDFAIAIKVDSNNHSANTDAKMKTEDIYFVNNKVRHAPGAIMLQGRDWSAGRAPAMKRVTLRNNICEDINRHTWGSVTFAAGSFLYRNNGPTEVTCEHNTAFNERYLIAFDVSAYPQNNFIFRNNITQGQAYPWNPVAHVYGSGTSGGTSALVAYAPSYVFTKNVIMGSFSTSPFTGTDLTSNWWPTSWSGVLVNQSGGDFHVVPGSVYDNGGTDGQDVGADVDTVNAATANATDGQWSSKDIVIRAAEATVKVGPWATFADAGASDGTCLKETDGGLAKVVDPLANPTSYFECQFQAQAGVEYHLWIRGKAPGNSTSSDSVHVQFTNTVDPVTNAPVYRIGTGGAASANIYSIEWVLENGSGTGLSGWGWRDSKWGTTTIEKRVKFATSGTQTIRCQRREDGVQIDEIVLSPATYMGRGPLTITSGEANYNPGNEKNDTTILAKQ